MPEQSTKTLSSSPLPRAILLCAALLSNHYVLASGGNAPKNIGHQEHTKEFSQSMIARIQKDAKDVERAFKLTTERAMTVCTNYWIEKCQFMDRFGKHCEIDAIKTESEFEAWLNAPKYNYEGISCFQNLRASSAAVKRYPDAFIPK